MTPRRISPFGVVYLDVMRAAAACVVLLGHIHNLLFVADPITPSFFVRLFYAIAARGHDAVIVFFVLSGLLIAASVMRSQRVADGWVHYAIARLARLYAVLLPALLLTALWDAVGISLFGDTYGVDDIVVAARMSLAHFFGSVFFLQDVVLPPFGSNQPLWSLAYEAWYYLMFPLLVGVAMPRTFWKRALCGVGLLVCIALIGTKISGYFLIWLMGAALFFLPAPSGASRMASYGWLAATWALLAAVIWCARKLWFAADTGGWMADMLVGAAIALHLYGAKILDLPLATWFARGARWLAGISFTLYLCHFPLLLLLAHLLVGDGKWQPDGLHLAAAGVITAAVIGYCALIAQMTEARTPQLRAWLERQIKPRGRIAYDAA